MALLYQGYAQQRGFGSNRVDIPDPSKKILDEGREVLGYMQDELDWNQKQSARLVQGLTTNAAIEAKNMRDNFVLSQTYAETIQAQKQRNFEALIKGREQATRAKEKQIQQLTALTKSGYQFYQAFDKKRKEDADIFAQGLWDETGIGLKRLNALKDITDEVWADSAKREAALTELQLNGVDYDILNRVRNTSGYRAVAIAKQDARRYAYSMGQYYAENWNTKVDLPGVPNGVDLASAKGSQVDTVLQLLDAQRRREMGLQNAPSSKMLALSGGYKIMEDARVQIRSKKRTGEMQEAIKNQFEDEILMIGDFIDTDEQGVRQPGDGFIKSIHYYAGHTTDSPASGAHLSMARRRVTRALVHGLEKGRFTWEQVRDMGEHEFTPRGQSTPVKVKDYYEKEWHAIEDAGAKGAKRNIAVAGIEDATHRAKDLEKLGEMQRLSQTPDIQPETWSKFLSVAQAQNLTKTAQFVGDQITRAQTGANDAQANIIVNARMLRGETVNASFVKELGASPTATAAIMAKVNEHNKNLPEAGGFGVALDGDIDAALESQIPSKVTGRSDFSRGSAKRGALTAARAQYKIAREEGASHAKAYEHARTYIIKRIQDKTDLWNPEWDKGTNQHIFSGFGLRGSGEPLESTIEASARQIHANPSVIYNEALVSKDELMKKAQAIARGERPTLLNRSAVLSSESRDLVSGLDIELAQIQYYNRIAKEEGTPLIPEYSKEYIADVRKTTGLIHPKAVRLLKSWNYCDINKAACNSGWNPIYQKPSIDRARKVFSPGTDYSMTEKGNSYDTIGLSLTTASIRQLSAYQQQGQMVTVGRYQFTPESLLKAAEYAGISLDEKFTPDIQDRLFEALFKKEGPRMIEQIQDPDERFIMEGVYESLTSDKLSSLRFHSPEKLNPNAYAELKRRNRYAVG